MAAEVDPVGVPERPDVGGQEIGPAGKGGDESKITKSVGQSISFALEAQPLGLYPGIALGQRSSHGGLERCARDVGEELLDRRDLRDQFRSAERPADLPTGRRERLAR